MDPVNNIANQLLRFQNNVNLYHWGTQSYARHKASDRLFKALLELIDKFMETLQGAANQRVRMDSAALEVQTYGDAQMVEYLRVFAMWLTTDLPQLLRPESTDLLSIRDEMLGQINQTLYLFDFQ